MKKQAVFLAGALSVFLSLGATAQAGDKPEIIPPPASDNGSGETETANKNPQDLLRHALDSYGKERFKDAIRDAQDAERALEQKRADAYKDLLPTAPGGGWVAEDGPDISVARLQDIEATRVHNFSIHIHRHVMPAVDAPTSLMRSYAANGHRVTIMFQLDPPLYTYAQLDAAQNSIGSSDEEVKGNKAVYSAAPNGGLNMLKILLDNVLVQVSSDGAVPKDTLLQFAGLIDFGKLKKLQ